MSGAAQPAEGRPARLVAAGAALLNLSVLVDSATEHYRGSFRDPAMVGPLTVAPLAAALDLRHALGGAAPASAWRRLARRAAGAVGLAGLGFHAYNVLKRPGGLRSTNLFYGAPIGAPAALVLAAALGSAADGLSSRPAARRPASGRLIGTIAAVGLAGSVGEAALMHFRGAFHDPFMWTPIVLAPVAAAALARDIAQDRPRPQTAALLGATAVMGLVGAGFHAYGVSRNMGGWRNWRQNVLAGPPLPAPPAFTGLALAALGAWLLMRRRRHG